LDCPEVEAAVGAGDSAPFLPSPQQVLDRVSERGDCFAPVLSCTQQLPE
jgi:hypothetical protein